MAPITAADQAFLQLLTQRKVLEESEALEAMDAVGSKLGGFGAFDAGGSGDARADLRATLANLNRKLASADLQISCLLYTSPSPRDATLSRMPSSA